MANERRNENENSFHEVHMKKKTRLKKIQLDYDYDLGYVLNGFWVISSAVEHLVYTEGVSSSNLLSPTNVRP